MLRKNEMSDKIVLTDCCPFNDFDYVLLHKDVDNNEMNFS